MNAQLYVAVLGMQIVVPQGEFRVVSDLARAWAKDNKQSPKVLTVAQFAKLPEQIEQAAERRALATINNRAAKNAGKAQARTRALVLKGKYTPEQLQASIKYLVSTGQHRNSDVLNKAQADQPLSVEQIAWIMATASAHRSAVATRNALA